MLINVGTLVYVHSNKLEPSQRYGVVVSSSGGRLLVQQLLSEEADLLAIQQGDATIVFQPCKLEN